MSALKLNHNYMNGIYKLRKIEENRGLVYSALDNSDLITVEEFEREIEKLLKEDGEAPIVAIAKSGERLNAIGLYLKHVSPKERDPQ